MGDEVPEAVWVLDSQGKLRGLHASCARWLRLEPVNAGDRVMYHTEVCLGCGKFLDADPPVREGTSEVDGKTLL
jgi:hypothetical protein